MADNKTCDKEGNKEAAKQKKKGKCSDTKKDCPLAHLIAIVKTSKGKVVGQAKVTLEGKGGGGDTDASTGRHDFGKIDPGTYQVVASKECHKPDQAKKSITLTEGEKKEVELVLDPYEIKIKAVKASYTVVLDKDGNEVAAHPILEFEISEGPPGHRIDVQLSRDTANGLTGAPGLAGAWDKSGSRADREDKKLFSSWTNGDTSLKLDGSGKAKYAMPLEWWRDLARIPLSRFDKKNFYYRVMAIEAATPQPCTLSSPDGGASAPKVEVKNNLTHFDVVDLGYINGGLNKSVRMEFKVREARTTEMYTMVNWNKGSNRVWGGARAYAVATDYGLTHEINIPEWAIDRLSTNPRYWDGVYTVSADKKKATATDKPGGAIGASDTHDFYALDFDTKLHLNFEVPASVTVTRKDGSPPVYGVVIGKLADPQPVTMANHTWDARILQVKGAHGTVTVTHPDTYGGP